MIQWREKLSNVKDQSAGSEIFNLIYIDKMSVHNAYIYGRVLF